MTAAHVHTHGQTCIYSAPREEIFAAAEAACAAAGETLTPLRRRVFELLIDSNGPAKAYDLLDALKGENGPAKPPTVYRALDFLVRVGLAHRIESLNAFVACDLAHDHAPSAFLICETCGRADEAPAAGVLAELSAAAGKSGFSIRRAVVEVSGECAECRAAR